ncbi:MAG: CorA family divalent cation transporter [Candidatus Micrarchaeota archaeon]|nr:CorA family divalent cation transporter [Candidatus Micrarchaeota archaeon]
MIRTFSDFNEFRNAATELGLEMDLQALTNLDVLFFESYENFLILNVRDYGENPNNLLILGREDSLLYSQKQFTAKDYKLFRLSMREPFGESSVITFLALRDVMDSYSIRFEQLHAELDMVDRTLDVDKLDDIGKAFRKFQDKLEDFVDLLIKLRDRKVPQVNTKYISYDYNVLTGKAQHILDRTKNQLSRMSGLRNELEVKETRVLNKRIENLSEVVKRLTAITIILMIPNIISGYFGMNIPHYFATLPNPELAIIALTAVLMLGGAAFLKWKDYF